MKHAEHPFTAIVGGAKVSDKLLIIDNLLNVADNILIGGGMAYTFMKAQGGHIGNSLCEDDRLELTLELLAKAKQKGVVLLLPSDSVAADAFNNDANKKIYLVEKSPMDGWDLILDPMLQMIMLR